MTQASETNAAAAGMNQSSPSPRSGEPTTAHASIREIVRRVNESVIGQERVVERLIIALLANGNVLVEGLPGLAKTRAIKSLSAALESEFSRIQFTPDLLPSDVTGGEIYLTTNIDAQRPVMWSIGAIAASGRPGALDLVRKILRASAAVPGAFQPVLIDVEVDGRKYQELHVDGGTIAQLFLYPPSVDHKGIGAKRERRAYIIRNARLDPDYSVTERRTITIAGQAISTMLAAGGRNDVLRTYFVTQRDGVGYNLAYIGTDFEMTEEGQVEAPPGLGAPSMTARR